MFTKTHLCLHRCNVDVILLQIKTQVCDFQLCDVYDKCRDRWLYDSEITAGTQTCMRDYPKRRDLSRKLSVELNTV